jgi:hypothetical protein
MKRIQDQIHTSLFREIETLRTARAYFADRRRTDLRILSFGCSIGDEIASLAHFFPDAKIIGCDADDFALETAQRSVGHIAEIVRSDRDAIIERGPFDLITACSALCINPPRDIPIRFPPALFDDFLSLFDEVLVPGGLLILTNSTYRFRDSPVFERFDAVRSDIVSSSGFVDVFSRSGKKFLIQLLFPAGRAHKRGPSFAIEDDEELTESIFRKRESAALAQTRTLRIAPPPLHFEERFQYRRSNLDSAPADSREDVVEILRHVRFGFDAETGVPGIVTSVEWQSLVHDGRHIRPPIWQPMPWE